MSEISSLALVSLMVLTSPSLPVAEVDASDEIRGLTLCGCSSRGESSITGGRACRIGTDDEYGENGGRDVSERGIVKSSSGCESSILNRVSSSSSIGFADGVSWRRSSLVGDALEERRCNINQVNPMNRHDEMKNREVNNINATMRWEYMNQLDTIRTSL